MDHNCDLNSLCIENDGCAACIPIFTDEECDLPSPLPYITPASPVPVIPGTLVRFNCISPLSGDLNVLCNEEGNWVIPYITGCRADFCDTLRLTNPNYASGVHKIKPGFIGDIPWILVYCDAETDGGDWLVIQRRLNVAFDFNRNKSTYNHGFGDIQEDFWIGNSFILELTSFADVELRIEFKVIGRIETCYATYERFILDAENTDFRLTIGNYSEGNCGDGLSYLDGLSFNVTENGWGGWWKNEYCKGTNLNAIKGSAALMWSRGCGDSDATYVTNITYTQMMIRRNNRTL